MAYCIVADVTALMGQTFSATSRPTTTEVQAAIDGIAAELNGIARAVGYTIPISSTDGVMLFKKFNTFGAAVSAWHTSVVADDEPARVTYWREAYEAFIARLRKGEEVIPGELLNASPNASFSASFKRVDGYSTSNSHSGEW